MRPRLKTTAISAVDLQGADGHWTIVLSKEKRKKEGRKTQRLRQRVLTLNVGTMTGKVRELANMMEEGGYAVQETRWKGSNAKSLEAGYKLFYHDVAGKKNGAWSHLEGGVC